MSTPTKSWVKNASLVEEIQLRLIYAAIYQVLNGKQFESDPSTRLLDLANDCGAKRTSVSRRFPPLKKVTVSLSKALRKVDIHQAQEKYQWLLRDNPDKLILQLIRQEIDSCKVAAALGKLITWHIKGKGVQKTVALGEEWLLTNSEINILFEHPTRYIAGEDMLGRPLVIARYDQSPATIQKHNVEAWTVNLNEQIRLLTQEHSDGATFIYDLTNFTDSANIELSIVKFLNVCFSSNYPGLVGRIIIHNAPKVFQTTGWKLYSAMLSPQLCQKVVFTTRTLELLNYIALDQLPKSLGGFSTYKYEWIPPPDKSERVSIPQELLIRQRSLVDQFDALTFRWILALYDRDHFDELRSKVLDEWTELYWEMDTYSRPRSLIDRNGMAPRLRPETVGEPPRVLSLVTESDYSSSLDTTSKKSSVDGQSVLSNGYDLQSIRSTSSRYATSISDSTKRALGFFKQVGRKVSISSSMRGGSDTASLRGSVRGH